MQVRRPSRIRAPCGTYSLWIEIQIFSTIAAGVAFKMSTFSMEALFTILRMTVFDIESDPCGDLNLCRCCSFPAEGRKCSQGV
jgi:hypothetical protein